MIKYAGIGLGILIGNVLAINLHSHPLIINIAEPAYQLFFSTTHDFSPDWHFAVYHQPESRTSLKAVYYG